MKKIYGVIELLNAEGDTVELFEVKSITPYVSIPNGRSSGRLDLFEDKKEADKCYREKFPAYDAYVEKLIDKDKQ